MGVVTPLLCVTFWRMNSLSKPPFSPFSIGYPLSLVDIYKENSLQTSLLVHQCYLQVIRIEPVVVLFLRLYLWERAAFSYMRNFRTTLHKKGWVFLNQLAHNYDRQSTNKEGKLEGGSGKVVKKCGGSRGGGGEGERGGRVIIDVIMVLVYLYIYI